MKVSLITIITLFSFTSFATTFECNVLDNGYNWDFGFTKLFVDVDYEKELANVTLIDENDRSITHKACEIQYIDFMGKFEAAVCEQESKWAYFFKGSPLFVMEESWGVKAQIECNQID